MPPDGVRVSEKRWLGARLMFANTTRLTCLATLGVLLGVEPSSLTTDARVSVRPPTPKGAFGASASITRTCRELS